VTVESNQSKHHHQRCRWLQIGDIQKPEHGVFRVDMPFPEVPSWLQRIQPLMLEKKRYLVGNFFNLRIGPPFIIKMYQV